jgi:L-ascorbate peroxidase
VRSGGIRPPPAGPLHTGSLKGAAPRPGAGLNAALGLLQPIKDAVPALSWSDLFQLGSAVAVQHAGGPFIPLRLGRLDAATEADCTPDGRLPDAAAPFNDGAKTPGQHLRNKFSRMGLTDQDIVVLSGAHTVGRARPDRSGEGPREEAACADGIPGAGACGCLRLPW